MSMENENQQSEEEKEVVTGSVYKCDDYWQQLPKLVEELRAEYIEPLTVKDWSMPVAISLIPVIGMGYAFFFAKKEKNPNKKSFMQAVLPGNAILTVIVILCCVMCMFININPEAQSNAEVQTVEYEQTEQDMTEEMKENGEVSENSAAMTDAYRYENGNFFVSVNGMPVQFPVSVSTYKNHGWNASGTAPDIVDSSQMIAILYDEYGSTAQMYYQAEQGESGECTKINVIFAGTETTFCGLNAQSTYDDVLNIFSECDNRSDSDYNSQSGTGIIRFRYGKYQVSVSLKVFKVSSTAVEVV